MTKHIKREQQRSKTRSLSKNNREDAYLEKQILPLVFEKMISILITEAADKFQPNQSIVQMDRYLRQIVAKNKFAKSAERIFKVNNALSTHTSEIKPLCNRKKFVSNLVVVGGTIAPNIQISKLIEDCNPDF